MAKKKATVEEKVETVNVKSENVKVKPRDITIKEIFNILNLNIESLKVGIKGIKIEKGIVSATLTVNIGKDMDALIKDVNIKNITSISSDLVSVDILEDPDTKYVLEKNSNIYKSITRKITLAIESENINRDNLLELWS